MPGMVHVAEDGPCDKQKAQEKPLSSRVSLLMGLVAAFGLL